MGVTGLWTVVEPIARPIKIETLNRKRLAVDASIWIYQFLKAVRDKEGNALRNSHVVGFFRRICKLLFFGIKPVFVFDGGAPVLKRQTISGRKARREGRREDAVRTAGKLLALQMQRRAEEEEQKRNDTSRRPNEREEEPLPENFVYVDELQMTQQERQQNRKFKKKDQYHLPDLDVSVEQMVGENDPRIMSLEDLEQYARQFSSGEEINVYDFSKIDLDSPFFQSLPLNDQYNIVNAARLRSRLRMGHTKEQLDTMFPNREDFSRFQIARVAERNSLTQRLMRISGTAGESVFDINGRVAGEKGREYVLVKNDGVEGGWALGVIGDMDEGERNKPIDVDELEKRLKKDEADEESGEEDDGFEDVPIEGLNRLPKLKAKPQVSAAERSSRSILQKRAAEYSARRSRKPETTTKLPVARREESNALFVDQELDSPLRNGNDTTATHDSDEEELQRAIAMSLEPNNDRASSPEDDDFEEVFQERLPLKDDQAQVKPSASRPAARALPFQDDSDDDAMDFAGALAESRASKRQVRFSPRARSPEPKAKPKPNSESSNKAKFGGPLPFEKLDLGSSLLGKKKAQQLEAEREGGFEREDIAASEKKRKAEPPPPWFFGDIEKDIGAQKELEQHDREKDREQNEQDAYEFETLPRLHARAEPEVIDIDELDELPQEVIDVDLSDERDDIPAQQSDIIVEDTSIRMGDLADRIRAEPPAPMPMSTTQNKPPSVATVKQLAEAATMPKAATTPKAAPTTKAAPAPRPDPEEESEEEHYEWEASDQEDGPATKAIAEPVQPAGGVTDIAESRSPSPDFEFENVGIPETYPQTSEINLPEPMEEDEEKLIPATGTADDQALAEDDSDAHEYYSDVEDEELMEQLAHEAEEHVRFASQLNHQQTQRQSMEDYERELKALRTQQKKDRRDADEVTQVMITECQQLLKLFGLPYITAPMEAEAQCAELVSLGLVDGIVTDDSDIFLFGGTRIYKNMFNQSKFVECYLAADLEREFDLTRSKLISLAQLLGSDYTEGLPGVGPVTALEVVSEFPALEGFRDWWSRVQTAQQPATADLGSAFRKKFRRNAAKLFLPSTFPDKRVEAAYLNPDVDHDPSEFQWGVPDLDALRSYLMATIGWSQERTDEVLVPVIKDMNRRETEGTQANITAFLGASTSVGLGAFAPRKKTVGKSKRMDEALEKMAVLARQRRKKAAAGDGESTLEIEDDDDDDFRSSAALAGEDAIVGQAGSLTEQRGLVGRAQVISPPKSSTTKNIKTPAKAKPSKKRVTKRKAVADSGDEEDEGSEDFAPKPKKQRAKRRAKA